MAKYCRKCGEYRELSEFHKDRSKKDGLASCCNTCAKEYRALTKSQQQRRWNDYYTVNKEVLLSKRKERYQVSSEREKEYRQKTRPRAAERELNRRASDLIFCMSKRLRKRVREAVRNIGNGKISKSHKTEVLLGCSFAELAAYLGKPENTKMQIDHVCPLAQAKTVKEVEALCNYVNLRWIDATENIQKGARRTEEGEHLCRLLLGREWE
jgi:hypothetical protein